MQNIVIYTSDFVLWIRLFFCYKFESSPYFLFKRQIRYSTDFM